jgi:hypothetical protein
MKVSTYTPEFVESIPESLEQGHLYISIRFRTAAHLCACGCESKVVTPIKPTKWHLTYDGVAVSLWPSIGNWQKPCQSHYWIRGNQVLWAEAWSKKKIEAGRRRDERELREYYESSPRHSASPDLTETTTVARNRLQRLIDRFKRPD